jgi:DNA helicase INO80
VLESDEESELDVPLAQAPKRRKTGKEPHQEIAVHLQGVSSASLYSTPPTFAKGKGKNKVAGELMPDVEGKSRKKPGPKRKAELQLPGLQEIGIAHSLSGEETPVASRPASPVPTVMSTIYELDEVIPPLKKARKVDDATMVKRVRNLEEAQRKVWTNIARSHVVKVRD